MGFLSRLSPDRTRSFRPVLVLLASLVLALTVLNTSTFARHAGMLEMEQEQRLAAAADHGVVAAVASVPEHELAPPSPSRDAMRLMHAVGACLLLIAAAVLLLTVTWWRTPGDHRAVLGRRPGRPVPTRSWRPPAFSPPALSPVLRT